MPKTKKQTAKKKCTSCSKFSLVRFILLTSLATFLFASMVVQFQTVRLLDVTIYRPIVIDNSSVEIEEELYSSANTRSEAAVAFFFTSYNKKDFTSACDVITDTKCDASSSADVDRFAQEYNKLSEGYNNLYVWTPQTVDFQKNVVCAQYDYQYNFDVNEKNIQETLSFYVSEEGKITARVCEKKLLDGEIGECPIVSKRDFCLG